MNNQQLRDDLKKILGLTPKYQKPQQRPRLLGGLGIAKMPAKQKEETTCLSASDLLTFNNSGVPSTQNARIIDGLFDVNTGRQLRVFIDPTAEICSDSEVTHYSKYTWYKLQLKNKHRAVVDDKLHKGDRDLVSYHWWVILDILSVSLYASPLECVLMRELRKIDTLKDTFYKMLSQTELNADAFFTTVPLSENLLNSNRDQYTKAVKEINQYLTVYINKANGYKSDFNLELYFRYQNQNSFEINSDSNNDKKNWIIYCIEQHANKKIPKIDGMPQFYKWTTNNAPISYYTAFTRTIDANEAYWGIPPENLNVYEARWKCADDLAYGVKMIKDYALKQAGIKSEDEITAAIAPYVKYADHYIQSIDSSDGAQQFMYQQDLDFYYRDKYDEKGNLTTDKDYKLFTTIKADGKLSLWSMDIYPDSGIIDMKFNPPAGKFIPMHPSSPDLLPTGLNNLSGLNMQDINGNRYTLTLNADGFQIHCALTGKVWGIKQNEYILTDIQKV